MKHRTANPFAGWRNMRLAARVGLLSTAVVLLVLLVVPVAWCFSGKWGLWAVAASAGICWFSALLALVVSYLLRGPTAVLYGLLFGMGLRMGIPLVFALVVHLKSGVLAEAGVFYYLLVFYPVTLGVETALSLPKTDPPKRCPKASQDASKTDGC